MYFEASLQALRSDETHITSSRNFISIEHTASVVLVAFLAKFYRLEKERILYGFVKNVHKIKFFRKSRRRVYS